MGSQLNGNNKDIHEEKNFIWIDEKIENAENKWLYRNLFEKNGINCKKFININEGYKYLTKKENSFKEMNIIVSGKLFNDFYKLLKENLISINFCPTIIIYTREKNKEKLINQLKMNNIYYNNDLFDKKLIFSNPLEIKNFINNKIPQEDDLTFDIIDNKEQLIIPCYYSYLFEDANISDIYCFNDYLIKKFKPKSDDEIALLNNDEQGEIGSKIENKKIPKLINQIKYKKLPKEILIKYWLRIYTFQSDFFKDLNKSLRCTNKQAPYSYPLIKLCYEGIKKGFLRPKTEELFRCSKISKEEFIKIQTKFNSIHDKKGFPKLIVFSRSFLSFSTEKKVAKRFAKEHDENFYSILYIIQEMNNIKEIKNQISNADIKDFSSKTGESEVLLFPFSCFQISDIKENNSDKIDYEINLKYLGSYSKYIDQQIDRNYFDNLEMSIFAEELFNSGVIKFNKFISTWVEREREEIKVDSICFFLEGGEDCISFKKKEIIVFNIFSWEIKQKINIHKDEILNIVKTTNKRIISTSRDGTIGIIKLYKNNTKHEVVSRINLNNYALKILFLDNEDIFFLDDKNNFNLYKYQKNFDNYEHQIVTKEYKILEIKELMNDKIIYISEKETGNKFINFINLKEKVEEKNIKKIEIENGQKLKVIDLLVFDDYIIIGYDFRVDIFNYKKENFELKSLEYIDYELTNIIILSSNRIILGLYDSKNNESIIRELILRVEDLRENKNNNYCIGEGNLEFKKIKDIIKINESQILINIENESCIIFERKNEISEELKKSLKLDNKKNEEEKNKYLFPKEKETNNKKIPKPPLKKVIKEKIPDYIKNQFYGNINQKSFRTNDNILLNKKNNMNNFNKKLEEESKKENIQQDKKEMENVFPSPPKENLIENKIVKKSRSYEKFPNI